MKITYEELFENKYIFESLGRGQYYDVLYNEAIKDNRKFPVYTIKSFLNYFEKNIYPLKKNMPNILILDYKFERIIDEQLNDFNFYIICNSYKQVKNHKGKMNCRCHFPHKWVSQIDNSFVTHDMSYALNAITSIGDYIKNNNIQAVLVGNDKIFIERAIIIAAMQIGVPAIAIQHGVYNIDSFKKLKTSYLCDYFWVWSQYVKELYINETGRDQNDVKVIGYPFKLDIQATNLPETILFLGNQYANSNLKEGDEYLSIAKMVYKICNEHGLLFRYRPHPAEKISSNYGELLKPDIISNKTLQQDLSEARVVVGDISSVMLEAGLIGKNVVQIIWSERSRVALMDPMYSFTHKCDGKFKNIEKAILDTINSKEKVDIDSYYLFRSDTFESDIKNLIKGAIKGKEND